MAYEPTPRKWVLVRMAILTVWPGLPVFGLLWWLTDLSIWVDLAIPAVIVGVLDILVESLREQSSGK